MKLNTKKKNKAAILIVALLILTIFIYIPISVNDIALAANESEPRDWDELTTEGVLNDDATSSEYAVLIDAHTGKVLYEENANEKRYPASITKIMTCLLTLENADLEDIVTVGDFEIKDTKATIIGIQLGEEISVKELLYGLMLPSGNDAAMALAIHVAGSVQSFVDLMNLKAAEIGMTNTHFMNPHGLHDDNHYSTAMDMSKLAFVAMQNPEFREIVSTYLYTPAYTNIHNEDNLWDMDVWKNNNLLISNVYDEMYAFDNPNEGHAIGIKTGYTSKALSTLVSAAVNEDETQEVIGVVLYSTPNGRFYDSVTMFKYAFDFYDTLNLSEFLAEGQSIKTHIGNATETEEYDNLEMELVPVGESYLTDTKEKIDVIKDHPEVFTKVENYNSNLAAPIREGQQVGTVDFYFNDETDPILTCTLVATNDVEALPEATSTPAPTPVPTATPSPTQKILSFAEENIIYIIIAVALLISLILIIYLIRGSRRSAHGRHSARSKTSSSSRGRQTDYRYRDGVKRGRGRRR